MGWSYGIGRYKGKVMLCVLNVTDGDVWGHSEPWSELLKHPIMVVGDILSQRKHIGHMIDIEKVQKRMKKYFKKIIKDVKK